MEHFGRIISCLDSYDPNALRVDMARQAIKLCIQPVTGVETVETRDALDRILAQEVVPSINVPAHDNSAMDGYALRAVDLDEGNPVVLEEIGVALAGQPFQGKLSAGQCVRITTGAVIPDGADTVVVLEAAKAVEGKVTIPAGQKAGQNVRRAGEDLKSGVPVLAPGKRLRPADLGLIASLGVGKVLVKRRIRVAFFSTGDELASIGSQLEQGQVYDSNRYTLHGMLTRLGVEILDLGVVRDDPGQLEAALRRAADAADAIVTTGGVSVGEADFIKQVLAQMGDVLFWKIAMRPGRPMAFGRIGKAYLFGLPGNPVAVMVTFHQFVRDGLFHLSGRSDDLALPLLKAVATERLRKVAGRTEFHRGILFRDGEEWKVRSTGQQGSGVLRSMSEANCYIVLEHNRSNVDVGELVQVQVFDGLT